MNVIKDLFKDSLISSKLTLNKLISILRKEILINPDLHKKLAYFKFDGHNTIYLIDFYTFLVGLKIIYNHNYIDIICAIKHKNNDYYYKERWRLFKRKASEKSELVLIFLLLLEIGPNELIKILETLNKRKTSNLKVKQYITKLIEMYEYCNLASELKNKIKKKQKQILVT